MKTAVIWILTGLAVWCSFQARAQISPQPEAELERAYSILSEAYRARDDGDEALAQEKMAGALSLFREITARRSPRLLRSSSDLSLEESPQGIHLIENRNLFKIEFKTDQAVQNRILRQQQELFQQQQLLLQKLALLVQSNTELKNLMLKVESQTKEISDIGSTVDSIQDDTSAIPDMDSRLDSIEDNTEDIPDIAGAVNDIADDTSEIDDIAGDVGDLKDNSDILGDILNAVEDVKDDTQEIDEISDAVDDLSSSSQNE